MKHMIAIVGPTAVGKSRLAMEIAARFNGEIINADSRHVYRYMDIATNKPTPSDRAAVPHHLLDLVDPDQDFNLATYKHLSEESATAVLTRGHTPLLVGGTGLYVWAVVENWHIPQVPPDPAFRKSLEEVARTSGAAELYDRLNQIDPAAASRTGPTNVRRIIRALEIHRATGSPPSQAWLKLPPAFAVLIIGLDLPRASLYEAINTRVESMIELGLVDEVKALLVRGYRPSLPSMSAIGYRQIVAYLKGQAGLNTAVEQIKTETHRLARHQYAWFRPADHRIHWLDASQASAPALQIVERFLSNGSGAAHLPAQGT